MTDFRLRIGRISSPGCWLESVINGINILLWYWVSFAVTLLVSGLCGYLSSGRLVVLAVGTQHLKCVCDSNHQLLFLSLLPRVGDITESWYFLHHPYLLGCSDKLKTYQNKLISNLKYCVSLNTLSAHLSLGCGLVGWSCLSWS